MPDQDSSASPRGTFVVAPTVEFCRWVAFFNTPEGAQERRRVNLSELINRAETALELTTGEVPGEVSAQSWHRDDWMQTFTGRQFYPLAPEADAIDIRDIAHALAFQCRYNGHTRAFYSVAEHSVIVSHVVPAEDALWGLMHDAAEAYVGDMVRPLKVSMPDFKLAEMAILEVIAQKYSLPLEIPASVHEADTRILLDEKAAFLTAGDVEWAVESTHEPLGLKPLGWLPHRAEELFLARFQELTAEVAA